MIPTKLRRLGLILALCSSLPSAARAQDKEKAKEHFKHGMALYTLEKYDEAIKQFEEGYSQIPDPAFLYNIAQSHRLSNRPEQAIQFYRKFLMKSPNTPNRAEVEEYISNLEKAARPTDALGPGGARAAPGAPPPRPTSAPPPSTSTPTPARPGPATEPASPTPAAAPADAAHPPAPAAATSADPGAADAAANGPPKEGAPKKRWPIWLGVGIGAAVLVGAGVTLGVLLGSPKTATEPSFEWSAR